MTRKKRVVAVNQEIVTSQEVELALIEKRKAIAYAVVCGVLVGVAATLAINNLVDKTNAQLARIEESSEEPEETENE